VLKIVLVALIIFLLQITVLDEISVAGAAPDLVVVLLIVLVLDRNPATAVIIGFMLGFLQDLGNASFLGMNALAHSIIAYAASHIGGRFFPESVLFKGLLIFTAAILKSLIVLIVTTSFALQDVIASFFRYAILSSIYTAFVGMVVLALVRAATGRVVRSRGGY
jgi:rod shape-determining protein MreD